MTMQGRMTPVDEAIVQLLAAIPPVSEREPLPLWQAQGRILATSMTAPLDVPPADNSAMDGFALRLSDLADAVDGLPVHQRIPAGHDPLPLQSGCCVRLFTGASIPEGADTVVMQEQMEECRPGYWRPLSAPRLGDHIRRQGQDIRKGRVLLAAGEPLDAVALGLLASCGIDQVPVVRKVRVGLFSSGDELVEPGQMLQPGQIYNTNRTLLRALLAPYQVELIDYGIVPDQREAVRELLRQADGAVDLLLSTGGVSVGEEDHVRLALEEVGQLGFWKLLMKPGKPLAFGQLPSGTRFLGLPGNPTSALLTFLLIGRRCLRRLQGAKDRAPKPVWLPVDFERSKPGSRREYLRARWEAMGDGVEGRIRLHPNQSSGVLMSAHESEWLVMLEVGKTVVAGDVLPCLSLRELLLP